ncbi:MAG: DUF3883 domain-containing protein [Chloroflexi bacterium]|nr:DUF3883 domain-containing protein [Chloroflexota bacterium]
MGITIDDDRFERAHQAFRQYMAQRWKGVPFNNFQNPFLINDEISYKWKVYRNGSDALQLEKWKGWRKRPGAIIAATKAACDKRASENLLVHQFGPDKYSEAALYRVKAESDERQLEDKLYDFFFGGALTPPELAPRFDNLAGYLEQNRLGCKWPFLAYLCFLADPTVYFPIRPDSFDLLLEYYGVNERLSRNISWRGYSALLDLADALRSKLILYGKPNAIEIQSYMWVISRLIKNGIISRTTVEAKREVDFERELAKRARRAQERERIGILGEQFVHEREIEKLKRRGRPDLAGRVQLVSAGDDEFGFDVLSFAPDGCELHIEVKTTTRSQTEDMGFWLSKVEKEQAERDDSWAVYRVWDIDTSPRYQDLGNVILAESGEWELSASNWFMRPRAPEEAGPS